MLTIIFLVLKLNGVINWDWIWVFSPIWISIIVYAAYYLIALIIAIIAGAFDKRKED